MRSASRRTGVMSKASGPILDSFRKQSHGMSSIPSGSLSSGSPTQPAFVIAVARSLITACMKTGTPTLTMPSIRIQRTNANLRDSAVVEWPPKRRSVTMPPEPATHAPSVHW